MDQWASILKAYRNITRELDEAEFHVTHRRNKITVSAAQGQAALYCCAFCGSIILAFSASRIDYIRSTPLGFRRKVGRYTYGFGKSYRALFRHLTDLGVLHLVDVRCSSNHHFLILKRLRILGSSKNGVRRSYCNIPPVYLFISALLGHFRTFV